MDHYRMKYYVVIKNLKLLPVRRNEYIEISSKKSKKF